MPEREAAPDKPLLDNLGVSLGPIALSLGGGAAPEAPPKGAISDVGSRVASAAGLSLGPIALSLGESAPAKAGASDDEHGDGAAAVRLNALTTEEWNRTHVREGAVPTLRAPALSAAVTRPRALTPPRGCCAHAPPDNTVDLWLEDDFNAPSRMPAGRPYGARENVAWSGKEAPDADVAVHSVRIKCVSRATPHAAGCSRCVAALVTPPRPCDAAQGA